MCESGSGGQLDLRGASHPGIIGGRAAEINPKEQEHQLCQPAHGIVEYPGQELQASCLPPGLGFLLGADPQGGSGHREHPLGVTEIDHIP